MKRSISTMMAMLMALVITTDYLQAQDAPPNPASGQEQAEQDISKQDQKAEGDKAQNQLFLDANSGYSVVDPYTAIQNEFFNPYQEASLSYLLRAYDPQQADSSQGKAVQYLLDGYYGLYNNAVKQDPDAQNDQVQDWSLYSPEMTKQFYNQVYLQGVQNYYDPQQNAADFYKQADLTRAYTFLLNAQRQNVSKYWIGLQTGPLSEDARPFLDIPEDQGVVVVAVSEDSPAEAAGLEVNDILLSLGGKPVGKVEELYEIIGENKTEPAEAEILRKGKKLKIEITPAERPQPEEPNQDATTKFWGNLEPGIYSPYTYIPGNATWDYSGFNSKSRIEELEKQVKELTERLEKLEGNADN